MENLIVHLRRARIVMSKRFELFKYNLLYKKTQGVEGSTFDAESEDLSRVMNMLDFS